MTATAAAPSTHFIFVLDIAAFAKQGTANQPHNSRVFADYSCRKSIVEGV
jgi:hypothetical protein